METLSSLLAEAKETDFEVFLRLINDAIELLSSEEHGTEKIEHLGKIAKIPSEGEATVIGDLHGDLDSLIKILSGNNLIAESRRSKDAFTIFLGDYGDRGAYSTEVYFIVLSLKRMFPEEIILLRGNHEGPKDLLAQPHDLPFHLQRKFGRNALAIYRRLTLLFEHLLLAVLVENKYVMLHGGVPAGAKSIEDIAYADEKHPGESHLEEILWSDPVEGITGTQSSPRGAGRLFGEDVTTRFLQMVDTQMIIRGHEPAYDGYKINHSGKVLTLFSRKGPPYHNRRGAYLRLDLAERPEKAWHASPLLRYI